MAAGLYFSFFFAPIKKFKKILIYFLIVTAVDPLIVGAGKQLTHIYTPWDLALFSGTLP
ncbi:MAG: phosphatase PAP2 family protein [Proteobacteria bacterium]|nr:phosphatase PAP2 family protein [Pseudomonadota bacterium]